MKKQIRALMIGAHPDDCEFRSGGLALKYSMAGHKVKFISICNGNCGHHEMGKDALAKRRYSETQKVAEYAGIEYDVWDIPDCEVMATLENRKRLIRAIREYKPDIIFSSRTNDYHADHRNVALLVQDASYLLIVPHFCPEVPAMREMPVIMHFYDHFQNPPFDADIAIGIDDVIERKFEMLAFHESQVYEWLPFSKGKLHEVPKNPDERLEWLHHPKLPRDGSVPDESILSSNLIAAQSEYREAVPAVKYRKKLIERYGKKGETMLFAEAFAVSEYGAPMTKESMGLIPF